MNKIKVVRTIGKGISAAAVGVVTVGVGAIGKNIMLNNLPKMPWHIQVCTNMAALVIGAMMVDKVTDYCVAPIEKTVDDVAEAVVADIEEAEETKI